MGWLLQLWTFSAAGKLRGVGTIGAGGTATCTQGGVLCPCLPYNTRCTLYTVTTSACLLCYSSAGFLARRGVSRKGMLTSTEAGLRQCKAATSFLVVGAGNIVSTCEPCVAEAIPSWGGFSEPRSARRVEHCFLGCAKLRVFVLACVAVATLNLVLSRRQCSRVWGGWCNQ